MSLIKRNQEKRKEGKRFFEKIKKQVQGITLIALVVTVIVLLILAGVAINLTVGNNGLFRRAQNAADTWQMAEQNERSEMEQAGNFLDDYTSEYNKATTVSYAKQLNRPFENDTKITDDLGNEVRIPAEFKIAQDSATLVEDGIVIEDRSGNQFVWIPARTEDEEGNEAGATIKLSTGGTATIVYQRIDYGKQSTKFEDFSETLLDNEKLSVDKWGGYYIGRYEAGDLESTKKKTMRSSTSNQNNTITIKSEQVPYNYISRANAQILAEEMAETENYITATTCLISSYAWDTAIDFIQKTNSDNDHNDYGNSSPEGNYSDSPAFKYIDINETEQLGPNGTIIPTGNTTPISNIYDMGGNLWEYTTENFTQHDTNIFVYRGGDFNDGSYEIYSAGCRYNNKGDANDSISFRIALYCAL